MALHAIHTAVDAMTGSLLDGGAEEYHATLYAIKKLKMDVLDGPSSNQRDIDDLGLPAEIVLPVASPLWNRLEQSIQQVKNAATSLLHQKSSQNASLLSRVQSSKNNGATTATTATNNSNDPATSLAVFLVTAGDALTKLGEATAAQMLCYDPAARLLRGGIASIDDDGTLASSNGYGQSIDQLKLRLRSTSLLGDNGSLRTAIVLHARSVFGSALSFARQVASVANKVGGTGRPGTSDPQLRYELTLRNLIERLDEVREAMSLVVMEQERFLQNKRNGNGNSHGSKHVASTSSNSLYWLLRNGTIAIFALADPMIVAGQGSSVIEHLTWSVLVVDACVELCTSKFLKWRTTLYRTLCESHISSGDWESGGRVAQKAKQSVLQLRLDENMDPPIPTAVENKLKEAYG
jgi:hypothetical protein